MTDVLLIQPPIRDFYLTAKRTIPQGLLCLASGLKKAGFSVALFDSLASKKSGPIPPPAELSHLGAFYGRTDISPFCLFSSFKHYGYSYQHIGQVIRKINPSVIGISSLFTPYCQEALEVARLARKHSPKSFIVVGGHHPTAFPEAVLSCDSVDAVIRGEGEISFPALVRAHFDRKPIQDIDGIAFRKTDGSMHVSPPTIIRDPDSLAPPDISLANPDFYGRKSGASMVIVTSRGCPMKCTYCCLANSSIPYRRRSLDSVMAEMEAAVFVHNVRFIDFEDENLSLDRKWFLALLREIQERFGGLGIELRAMNGLFPLSLDRELIARMREAGFKALNLSLGSTHPERLKKMNRPDVTSNLEALLKDARREGLEAVGYVIAGAPGQSWQESLADLLYLARLPLLAGVSIYYPAPQSKDFERARALGTLPPHFSLMRSSALSVASPMTPLEAVTLLRLSRMVNFMKSLVDRKIPIPEPSPCRIKRFEPPLDRTEVGLQLLSWFFHDAAPRGVDRLSGEIYRHHGSTRVANRFINAFGKCVPRGVQS